MMWPVQEMIWSRENGRSKPFVRTWPSASSAFGDAGLCCCSAAEEMAELEAALAVGLAREMAMTVSLGGETGGAKDGGGVRRWGLDGGMALKLSSWSTLCRLPFPKKPTQPILEGAPFGTHWL